MWKPKIYIGTSIIDSIFQDKSNSKFESKLLASNISANSNAKKISKLLISKCQNELEFEGYVSPFTIVELSQRYSKNNFSDILKYLNKNDIKLIKYCNPKEIDYLVKHYEHKSILTEEFQYDYYHIATCAYLNIEFYISWNIDTIANFNNFKNIMYCHTPRGYRSIFQFRTPEYLVARQCSSNLKDILVYSIETKRKQYSILNKIKLEQQALHQENEALGTIGNVLDIKTLPESINKAARIPTLEVGKTNLEFKITNYENDNKNKAIPLLDLDHESMSMDVHFGLLKLEV